MAEKEFLPTGVQLIEAGYGGRVADLSTAPVQGIVVAVVDTGEVPGRATCLVCFHGTAYNGVTATAGAETCCQDAAGAATRCTAVPWQHQSRPQHVCFKQGLVGSSSTMLQ